MRALIKLTISKFLKSSSDRHIYIDPHNIYEIVEDFDRTIVKTNVSGNLAECTVEEDPDEIIEAIQNYTK